jgi:hypothetical protein
MLTRILVSIVAVLGSQAQAFSDDRSELCGYVYPVAGYLAEVGGLRISLPANDRLVVKGRVLAEHARFDEGSEARPWQDSANTAQVALAQDYVLVQTMWTDCVDYSWSRIYVLDRAGALVTTSALWSLHDESSFRIDPAGLMFSSSWFCSDQSGAPRGRAFVYVLRKGATAFAREERAWDDVCSAEARRSNLPLHFANMQPVLPAQR